MIRQGASSHLISLALILPVALALAVGILQWDSSLDFRAARVDVFKARSAVIAIGNYLSVIKDAETGQRGYLLTGKESYLAPYSAAVLANSAQVAALRRVLGRSQSQLKNLDRLEPLVNAKLAELGQTIDLQRKGDHDGALRIVQSDFGKNTMDKIRQGISDMLAAENDIFAQKEATYQHRSQMNLGLSAGLIGIGLISIVTIFFLMRRVEKFQNIVKICAWSKMIEFEGEWLSIEQYLERRLHAKITHSVSEQEASKLLRVIKEEKTNAPGPDGHDLFPKRYSTRA